MANSTVAIKTNDKGAFVNYYDSNTEFGYIVLEANSISTSGGWVRETKRSCLIRGRITTLEKFIADTPGKQLPGRLVVREFLEDAIPQDIAAKELRDDLSLEEALSVHFKRAGKDGVILSKDGKRIVRFTEYDSTGAIQDVIISHDNVAEVNASKAQGVNKEDAPF